MVAELAAHGDVAAERSRLGAQLLGGALADGAEVDGRQRELRRPREVQEVGDDLAERLGLGANAFDVRPVGFRQRLQVEQLAVAVNRRQPVAELVSDARRQLADRRQALLQPQLLFEVA